jgi:hypothetical protein
MPRYNSVLLRKMSRLPTSMKLCRTLTLAIALLVTLDPHELAANR